MTVREFINETGDSVKSITAIAIFLTGIISGIIGGGIFIVTQALNDVKQEILLESHKLDTDLMFLGVKIGLKKHFKKYINDPQDAKEEDNELYTIHCTGEFRNVWLPTQIDSLQYIDMCDKVIQISKNQNMIFID